MKSATEALGLGSRLPHAVPMVVISLVISVVCLNYFSGDEQASKTFKAQVYWKPVCFKILMKLRRCKEIEEGDHLKLVSLLEQVKSLKVALGQERQEQGSMRLVIMKIYHKHNQHQSLQIKNQCLPGKYNAQKNFSLLLSNIPMLQWMTFVMKCIYS